MHWKGKLVLVLLVDLNILKFLQGNFWLAAKVLFLAVTGHPTRHALLPAHGAEKPAADDDTELPWSNLSHEVLY